MNNCSERPHSAAASQQIRPRCARLLAKPEYFSPPNEVCGRPGHRGEERSGRCCWPRVSSGRNLLAKAHKQSLFVLGRLASEAKVPEAKVPEASARKPVPESQCPLTQSPEAEADYFSSSIIASAILPDAPPPPRSWWTLS